ncbi:MAG TPA: DUF222 domain-containing protein [Acidimicrobiales bacterium]|nr:DUF222 domain-containing protein [Acidimicrobiales bacterium]
MRSALLADVHEALDAVDADGLVGGALADAAVDAYALLHRVQALCTSVVGRLDAEGVGEGAVSTASWVAWRCKETKAVARRDVSNARALRELPAVEEAFGAGEIGPDHVRALGAAMRVDPEAFEKVERALVDEAARRLWEPWRRIVEYWRQQADEDLIEREARDRDDQRRVHCSQTFERMWRLDGVLTPVGGAIYDAELRRIEAELFEADRRDESDRTPAQRRHDAHVEMARRSAAMAPDAKRARPLVTVLVGYETFAGRICEMADGSVVTPGEVLPLLTEADVERVVFDGPSRVIDVGAKQRLFTGATKRAVQVRDQICFHESCDRPASECQVDHVVDWVLGGPTIQANGQVACPKHNRDKPPLGPGP